MCGIFAVFGSGAPTAAAKLASARQAHRGPNSSAAVSLPEGAPAKCTLVHERLSIIDVAGGAQPFVVGSVAMVANGEVYDYREHRETLQAAGHTFNSDSDCEVLVHLYMEYGENFLEKVKVSAMFAMALYDARNDIFVVARDHIGIIPVHWGKGPEGTVWVASELKCLASGDDHGAMMDAPENIAQFPPGSFYSSNSGLKVYYNPPWYTAMPTGEFDEFKLRKAMFDAVESHLMSDVPYGVLLSGGLDSSLIAATAQHVLSRVKERPGQHIPRNLITFTIGFEDSEDIKLAREAATFIGSDHHEFFVTPSEVIDALRSAVYHLESFDPGLIRPGLMQMLMAKRIKELGLKVVLSGEGADEIFAGYPHYKNIDNPTDLHAECVGMTKVLHRQECARANKSMMAHSVELRVPFLDRNFLDAAFSFDTLKKMPLMSHGEGKTMEKWVLRRAGAIHPQLLPNSVLWRVKDGFSTGVGNTYTSVLNGFFEEKVLDQDVQSAAKRWSHCTPTTKEEFYIRSVWEEMFWKQGEASIDKMWKDGRIGMKKGEEYPWIKDPEATEAPKAKMAKIASE